jgi:SAM-dependent methyltransferase
MDYTGCVAQVPSGLGCGSTCGCRSCRTGSALSEWYIEDDDEDDDDPESGTQAQAKDPLLGGYATLVRIARPYSQLAAAYDRALGLRSFIRTKRAFEFVVQRYGIRFRSAADVGCGTGLFARYLSHRWRVPVFAVDRSQDMLRVAACRGRRSSVRFLRQDLRDLCLPCPVDLVTANFDTVNHILDPRDLGRAFGRIAANLRPDGHFVFDVITRQQGSRRVAYTRRLRASGRQLLQKIRWDPRRGMLSITIVHRWPGRAPPSVEFHTERAYAPAEVSRLLNDAGFAVLGVHDATTLMPPAVCPPRLLVVARKRGAAG